MARNWYRRRRTVRELVGARLAMLLLMLAMAVAARLDEEPPVVETVELTPAERAEVVGRWYGEIYPSYVAPRR